jgi:hypothetical protein
VVLFLKKLKSLPLHQDYVLFGASAGPCMVQVTVHFSFYLFSIIVALTTLRYGNLDICFSLPLIQYTALLCDCHFCFARAVLFLPRSACPRHHSQWPLWGLYEYILSRLHTSAFHLTAGNPRPYLSVTNTFPKRRLFESHLLTPDLGVSGDLVIG